MYWFTIWNKTFPPWNQFRQYPEKMRYGRQKEAFDSKKYLFFSFWSALFCHSKIADQIIWIVEIKKSSLTYEAYNALLWKTFYERTSTPLCDFDYLTISLNVSLLQSVSIEISLT